ncbi:MAG: phosphomethylpyrimidine synthase ThiC, partial [Chromatiales bacterium]|nr:phosphomethylpyrimidine synthase ThiC [Chromatiales bacterium]
MSAIPEEFISRTDALGAEAVKPFPRSEKVYVAGSRPDIRVPMRRVALSDTPAAFGAEANPSIDLYDTSGPYTDPNVEIDLRAGLPDLRGGWIEERGDTEPLDGPSSQFGRARQSDPALAHLRFEHIRAPRRARAGANVTQMHYARKG